MAVYTELSDAEIEAFLSNYTLPRLARAEGIAAGVENTNYCLTLEDGSKRILTIFEKRVEHIDLPFFTGLMQTLASYHVPCPEPVPANSGKLMQQVKGKTAIITSFLQGKSVSVIGPAHLYELGGHIARMHHAAHCQFLKRENALGLSGWKLLLKKIESKLDSIEPGLQLELNKEWNFLNSAWPRWPEPQPRGVIHADLFPDNVFFNEHDKLTGIIDFYFACNDILAYDLAIVLNAWCFENNREFNITKAQQLLQGYNEERKLSEDELRVLPVLARGAALRFLLTRAHDALNPAQGALVTPKDPLEYLKKLRFHQSVMHHREYGL